MNIIASDGFIYPELCCKRMIHIHDLSIYILPDNLSRDKLFFNFHNVCEIDYHHKYILRDDDTSIMLICQLKVKDEIFQFYKDFENISLCEKWFTDESKKEIYLRLHGKYV